MRKRLWILALAVLVAVLWIVVVPEIAAYEKYHPSDDTETGDGCYQCHGWNNDANPVAGTDTTSPFRNGGFNSRGPLHDLHQDQITGTCGLCHISPGDVPFTYTSGDAQGQGCRGCHGADPDPQNPNFNWGAGLRLHHANAGAPADLENEVCADCHDDPLPLPEDTIPLYYSRADVNAKDPCNADGTEDWGSAGAPTTPDGQGLDNDGDLAYDGNDSDCGTGAQQLLTVNKLGQGDGTVTSDPAGIDCGGTCQWNFASDSDVGLTAARGSNSTFDRWGGDCSGTTLSTTVTMSTDKTCTATFESCVSVKDVSGETISDEQYFEACTTLFAATFQVLGPGGVVTLLAGLDVVLGNGFEVLTDGTLVAGNDAALLP